MAERHAGLERLRSWAALAVVGVHVAAPVVTGLPGGLSAGWWVANILDAFLHACVPVFVMISGALLLAGPVEESAFAFYRRRARRVGVPLVFWSALYLGVSALIYPGWQLSQAAVSVLRGTPYYHLWYLYMLPGLYLATPFLRRIVAASSRSELRLLILACCTLAALDTLSLKAPLTFLSSFLPVLGYFLLGHYLFTLQRQVARWPLVLLALVAGCGVAGGVYALRPWLGERAIGLLYAYPNPLLVLLGASVFLLGLRPPAGRWAQAGVALAPLSLGIYLIHPLWLLALSQWGITGFLWQPALGIPLTTLACFTLSALSTAALLRVPLLREVVG